MPLGLDMSDRGCTRQGKCVAVGSAGQRGTCVVGRCA